jgi:CubicO group peptidase (beta-lactamase class C family)
MNSSILLPFRMTVAEKQLGVYGVHVYQEGEGEARHLFRSDDFVNIYSFSKTFSSVGVGICQDEGKIKLTDSLLSFFPEYKDVAAAGSEKITLRDLLHMSSGKNLPWPPPPEVENQMDIAEFFFRAPMTWQPGEHFYYSNHCTYMLGRVVEKVSGETMRDYLVSRLFTPLGIHNPQWFSCLRGHTVSASSLFLKLDDMAKMGRLLLQKGEWNGQRIVSAAYVDAMHTDAVPNAKDGEDLESASGYGYQVWRCSLPGVFRADGMYGQYSVIFPEKKAAVTVKSHREHCAQDILRAIYNDILPLL